MATKRDVLNSIRRMGALQIDTISVLERSPYFVLWTRVGSYPKEWLNDLLAKGDIFEYWSHAACFLPAEDYPLYQPFMNLDWQNWRRWLAENQEVTAAVRQFIVERGEAKSSDFEHTGPRAGRFWAWKKEKLALECLFRMGEVMTLRRDTGFQRIYAPRDRVLRGRSFPDVSKADATRAFTLRAVKHLGVARASWVADYFRLPRIGMEKALEAEVAGGNLLHAVVDGWDKPVYIHPDNATVAKKAAQGKMESSVTTILTPFDPVIWHRPRALELFNFEYQIEVYTPVHKRKYGYFNLPILHRGELVGRLDAKAHRQEQFFEVREMHLETGTAVSQDLLTDLSASLQSCAAWHKTPAVRITAAGPFAAAMREVADA